MKIKRLTIENVKRIGKLEVDLDPNLTVFLGLNGVGKTTILDSISLLLIMSRSLWPKNDGTFYTSQTSIGMDEIRNGGQHASIEALVDLEGMDVQKNLQTISTAEKAAFRVSPNPWQEIKRIRSECSLRSEDRPLFVYYRQRRGFDHQTNPNQPLRENVVYEESLNENLSMVGDLGKWWDVRSAAEGRAAIKLGIISHRDAELETVRELVTQIDGFTGAGFESDLHPPGLYFTKTDNTKVHVDQLSSGERAFLILLADLARRLHSLAPTKNISEINGIVLIDEIELNLHPAWQSKILKLLRHTFKACQFIVTTHSPQVVSSVEREHVRILEADDSGLVKASQPRNTKGRSSDFLLEGVFGATDRDPEVATLLDQFDDAIDDEQFENARALLEQIEQNTDGDPEVLPVLVTRLQRLKRAVK